MQMSMAIEWEINNSSDICSSLLSNCGVRAVELLTGVGGIVYVSSNLNFSADCLLTEYNHAC